MFSLKGKAALVTGAASGIGAATAEVFAKAGADLVLCWNPDDPYDVSEIVGAVERHGRRGIAFRCDVRAAGDADLAVTAALDAYGRLDIVVANAGITRDVPSESLGDEAWAQVVDVNLTGVFRCFRAALRPMTEAGAGRLLATSSVAGPVQGWPRHVHYSATKAGITGLIRSLAVEVAPQGITVNGVAPGTIESPQSLDEVNSLGAQALHEQSLKVPVGRGGQPTDVANVFVFLASDEAAFMTGQTIVVDGGASLSSF